MIHHELRTWTPLADDLGPTPETAASPSARDPVLEAALRGTITDEEFRAARMIASIVEEVCASVMPRARQLGMGRASGGSADRISHWASIRYSAAYRPWAKRVGPVGVQPVLAFAVHGLGLYAVARRHRRAYRPMIDYIRSNLRLFAQFYREADLGLMGSSLALAMDGPMGSAHVARAPGKIGRKGKVAGNAPGHSLVKKSG